MEELGQYHMEPWELLSKEMIWDQIGNLKELSILDYGSGKGITANHYAKENHVIAIEPSSEELDGQVVEKPYLQIVGGFEELRGLESNSMDMIFCHNVLEYAEEREDIVKEFYRILKAGGKLSLVKHNRAGCVMLMVVLLNHFEHAKALLDGKDGHSENFGTIHYYKTEDITKWVEGFVAEKTYGIRTFWDLQQKQEMQKNTDWQMKMLELEKLVSDIDAYKQIAFFHHIILRK